MLLDPINKDSHTKAIIISQNALGWWRKKKPKLLVKKKKILDTHTHKSKKTIK